MLFWVILIISVLTVAFDNFFLMYTNDDKTIIELSKQSTQTTHYIAAVVEYMPEGNPWELSASEVIGINVENYQSLILNASHSKADIIVFPEYGLTTLGVPRNRDAAKPFMLSVPSIGINPCEEKQGSSEIQKLSCSANNSEIYVVVNLAEMRTCSSGSGQNGICPSDGVFQFNTNVVFNRQGTIVAKYEKTNLYFEEQFDKPNPIQLSTFISDFGVEFGLFTCYDIIFHDPAVQLVEIGVKNFIFPTAWVDELPFLTAIQSQATWADSSNANLLASGYHQPLGGQLGSGIYSGKNGALIYTFDPESGTQIKLAKVPILPEEQNLLKSNKKYDKPLQQSNLRKSYNSFLREDLANYTTKILSWEDNFAEDQICTSNDFCCIIKFQFDYSSSSNVSNLPRENYRLVAFNGTRTVAAKTSQYDWQICGVMRCLNETLESCTENDSSSSELNIPNFKSISLRATFDMHRDKLFLPGFNSLDIYFDLIPSEYFEIETIENIMQISSEVLKSVKIKTLAMLNKLFDV